MNGEMKPEGHRSRDSSEPRIQSVFIKHQLNTTFTHILQRKHSRARAHNLGFTDPQELQGPMNIPKLYAESGSVTHA